MEEKSDLITALEFFGVAKADAKVLILLLNVQREMAQKEIERELNVSQPAVSLSLNRLNKRGWVRDTGNFQKNSEGRPTGMYIAGKNWTQIAYDLTEAASQKTNIIYHSLSRISLGGAE